MPIESQLRRYEHLYIDGQWVKPTDGEVVESIDPATGRPRAIAPLGGVQNINLAVAATWRAFSGPWRRMPARKPWGLTLVQIRSHARMLEQLPEDLVQRLLRSTLAALRGYCASRVM